MEAFWSHQANTTGVLGELTELSKLLDRVEEQIIVGREVSEGAMADLERAAEVLADVASRDFLRFDETLAVIKAVSRTQYVWRMVERAKISRDLREAQDRLRDAVGADAWQLYLDIEEIHNSRNRGGLQAWHGCLPSFLAIAALLAGAPAAARRARADKGSANQEG